MSQVRPNDKDNIINALIADPNVFVEVCTLKDHSDWVRDVAFCPSIGAPYDILVSCSEVRRLRVHFNNYCGRIKR